MRIILMIIQIVVLLAMAFAAAATAGGMASMTALSAGYGPAAMAAGVYVLVVLTAAAAALVAIVLPISLLAAFTLFFAVLSGYRYLRWTRVCGILANAAGAAYFLLPFIFAEQYPPGLVAAALLYPGINVILFLLLPRRPSVYLTRKFAYIAVPLLYAAAPMLVLLVLLGSAPSFAAGSYAVLAAFLLLYTLPFYYVFNTIPATKQPNTRLAIRLAVSVAMATLMTTVVPPIGIPLAASAFLLMTLAEMSLLYPPERPPYGGARYWIARTLGRLPDESERDGLLSALRHTAAATWQDDAGQRAAAGARTVWLRAADWLEKRANTRGVGEGGAKENGEDQPALPPQSENNSANE